MNRDPRIDPQPRDEVRGVDGQTRRVIQREGDKLWCQDGVMRYQTTVQRWQEWCKESGESPKLPPDPDRDPR